MRNAVENSIPKRAFTFIEARPSEKIYEICIALNDVCGAVAMAAKVLSDAKVNIRTSTLFIAEGADGFGYWASFVDFSKATTGIKQLEKNLRNLDFVEDVKVIKPSPLAYDAIHFPIIHGGSLAMIMPIELFGSLFEEIEKILTPSGFVAVFYNAGKKSGAFIATLLSKRYQLKGDTLSSALVQATKALGWGQVEAFTIDKDRLVGKVKVRSCFEALLKFDRNDKVCHWTRGIVAGFLSEVIGKQVEAVELKCAAAGDEICEFEIKPKI